MEYYLNNSVFCSSVGHRIARVVSSSMSAAVAVAIPVAAAPAVLTAAIWLTDQINRFATCSPSQQQQQHVNAKISVVTVAEVGRTSSWRTASNRLELISWLGWKTWVIRCLGTRLFISPKKYKGWLFERPSPFFGNCIIELFKNRALYLASGRAVNWRVLKPNQINFGPRHVIDNLIINEAAKWQIPYITVNCFNKLEPNLNRNRNEWPAPTALIRQPALDCLRLFIVSKKKCKKYTYVYK